MSFKCVICGKGPKSGNKVSHSHKASNRTFMPNLQHQKIILAGKKIKAYVCTNCIKSGEVIKAI
ncbi:MAG: 50S ribosomal protein L28 [Elusimicrobia bacterium]|nr:50S ribosomal protein L28 [Candidatus Liberimonas magnetica]